ncbi:MAG: hypothetical protein GY756_14565 [bacterium]|nr:hypothetical protein [bacterium]
MTCKNLTLYKINGTDKNKDKNVIKIKNCNIYSVCIPNFEEALEVCLEYIREKNIDSIILCAGFTNIEVGEIDKATGENINVSVVRNDSSPSTMAAREKMKEAGII